MATVRGRLTASLAGVFLIPGAAAAQGVPNAIVGSAQNTPSQVAAEVLVGQARNTAAAWPTPNTRITYGPTKEMAEAVIGRAGNVFDVIGQLGAPYATYKIGNNTVYRWGHGVDEMQNGIGSILRNELLVVADDAGKIASFSYKNKADLRNLSVFAGQNESGK